MGRFDRKVNKHEPDAPTSQTIKKKKSSAALAKLESNPKGEKDRNLKILTWMNKAAEIKANEKLGGKRTKADAHIDADKMVKNHIRKEEKKKRKTLSK